MKTKWTRLAMAAGGILLAVAGAGPALAIDSAQSGNWNVGGTWAGGNVPTINDAVTIKDGHTITNTDALAHDAGSLTIQPNGVLTHSVNGSSETCKLILNIAGNLTVDGQINVDGRGYGNNYGPGAPPNTAAGSHGGVNAGTYYGITYGSVTAPTNIGSGGRGDSGGYGGGAVRLNVAGATAVNGIISASGRTTANYTGSGGSVFLTTGTLSGNGTVRANGGTATDSISGGGGRVAVVLTNATEFGGVSIQAYAGSGANPGAGGTVYLEKMGQTPGHGKLIVDYGTLAPNNRTASVTLQNGLESSSHAFSEIVLTNGGVYALDANDTLDITATTIRGDLSSGYDGIYVGGGTLTVPAVFVFSNYFIGISAVNSTFNPTTSLTVGSNATLKINQPFTLNCPLTLLAGGILDHSVNGGGEYYKINLTVLGDLDIQTGAEINVDGKGYGRWSGPGGAGAISGAGHGGVGGYHPSSPNPGAAYGSVTAPTNIGSGGAESGAYGGGAVMLTVNGMTTLNGKILARAADVGNYQGAGGSVYLTTGTLTGNGPISARAWGGYGPGAGGRVSVVLTNGNNFGNVTMDAYSTAGTGNGSPGTVYTQTKDQGPGGGTLLIDANNATPGAFSSTLINGKVTDAVVGTVVIANAAKFQIDTNQSLTVNGSWTNAATFIASTNSTVTLASASMATVAGDNTFHNLTVTNAGKTVSFQAGRTNTVNGLLKLGATGSDPLVTLQSTAAGNQWYLTLTPGGTPQIARVSVKDSNAGGGQPLTAGKGSVNELNNINWLFPKSGGTVVLVK